VLQLELKLKLWANSLFACSEAYQSAAGACYHFQPSAAAYYHPVPGLYMSCGRSEQYLIVVREMVTKKLTPDTNPKHTTAKTPNFKSRSTRLTEDISPTTLLNQYAVAAGQASLEVGHV
jgi:hypothetical protein